MSFKLVLHMDIVDPETGLVVDSDLASSAWFRKQRPGGPPCLADTVGDLLARTGLAVQLVDAEGNTHDVIAKTTNYATLMMVTRGQPYPFDQLAIMTDEIVEDEKENDR